MTTPLKALIVEDEPDDAALMIAELRRVGFEPTATRVAAEADFRAGLESELDVILSDYTLPRFDARRALEILKERRLDVPFIIVSGTIGDELGVECMRDGAADYLLKDRLARLGGAVRRAIAARRARAERRQARLALEESERRHRIISELTSDFAYAMRVLPDGRTSCEWVAGAFTAITGYAQGDMLDPAVWANLPHPDDRDVARRHWRRLTLGYPDEAEFRIVARGGRTRRIHHRGQPEIDRASGRVVRVYAAGRDVTAQYNAQRTARLLTSAVEHASDAVTIATADLDGAGPRILYVNAAFSAMTGYALDEIRGRAPSFLRGSEDDGPIPVKLKLALAQGHTFEDEIVSTRKDGSEFVAEWKVAPIPAEDGRTTHLVAVQRDITERRRQEQALRVSEERYALAARGANDGLWDWDLGSNRLYLSDRWYAMLGHDRADPGMGTIGMGATGMGATGMGITGWLDLIHDDDRARFFSHLDAHLKGEIEHLEIECRMLHADGSYRWFLIRGIAARDDAGKAVRVAGSATDVTERKRLEASLIHDALHDSLTGLPNRTLFLDRVSQSLRRAERHRSTVVAVLVLDLDRFNVINDSLGHAAGNDVLRAVAGRLAGCIRASDTLARLGGDEFAILLDEVTHEVDASHVADRCREALAAPFSVQGHAAFVAVSIGIAVNVGGTAEAATLLQSADTAMHRAKELGRSRNEIFDETMHNRSLTLLQLESDLRRAIERQQFRLHYQPIVRAGDGAPVALEALIRWDHPDRGLVPPSQFVAFAEETGLIVPIGEWALDQAIEDLHRWDARGLAPVRLSFNLSVRQLLTENLAARLARTLRQGDIPGERLEVELTESTILDNSGAALATLKDLRARGIQVAIDDFGTGYSSLSYLHELPVSSLKIDRSFVQRISDQTSAPKILKMIVNMAHDLGLRAIAEGVETAQQRKVLRGLGCDELQGFLFSRPTPIDDVIGLFQDGLRPRGRGVLAWMRPTPRR